MLDPPRSSNNRVPLSRLFVRRRILPFGLVLVAIGIFVPWYSWSRFYAPSGGGFIGVELATVGTVLFLLASFLLAAVVAEKPRVATVVGILLLVISVYIMARWGGVYYVTHDRLVRTECMPPCVAPPPGPGLYATLAGSILTVAGGLKTRGEGTDEEEEVGHTEENGMKLHKSRIEWLSIGQNPSIIRWAIVFGGALVAIGVFLPWGDFSSYYSEGFHAYSGVDLAFVGTALVFLAILLMTGIIVGKQTLSALAAILLLSLSWVVAANWSAIFSETWDRIERSTGTPDVGLAAGFYVTVLGAALVVVSWFISLFYGLRKRIDSRSAGSVPEE